MATIVDSKTITIFANGIGPDYSWLVWFDSNDPRIEGFRWAAEQDDEVDGKHREWTVEIPSGMSEDEVFWWAMNRMWVSVG